MLTVIQSLRVARSGKCRNHPFEVLELDLSGFPTNQELSFGWEGLQLRNLAPRAYVLVIGNPHES